MQNVEPFVKGMSEFARLREEKDILRNLSEVGKNVISFKNYPQNKDIVLDLYERIKDINFGICTSLEILRNSAKNVSLLLVAINHALKLFKLHIDCLTKSESNKGVKGVVSLFGLREAMWGH